MNPLEHDGTFPLPAAQLDRFTVRLSMGYPPEDAEIRMLDIHLGHSHVLDELQPVISTEDFLSWQQTVPYIYVSDAIKRYVVSLVTQMRNDTDCLQAVSPRAIAELKLEDLNTTSVENAMNTIAGTARSMGLTVIEG